jgi:hypothetical protein
MSKLLSRKNFMISLCKRGIPARYAWRVSKELNDHAEDLNENQSESSLGDTNELLDQIESTYKQRTFAERHPLLVFLMAPLPVVIMIYILSMFLPVLMVHVANSAYHFINGTELPTNTIGLPLLNWGIHIGLLLIPAILSTIVIFRWARISGLKPFHSAISCIPAFLLAFGFQSMIFQPDNLSVAFGFSLLSVDIVRQLLQTLIPALAIFYMLHHEKVKQQRLAEKLVTTE